jgi:hypothetical protein
VDDVVGFLAVMPCPSGTVTKVEDPEGIVGYRVRSTPGLVVDGSAVSSGRVPSSRALVGLLR